MPRVVHFEIHADNPESAVKFYSNIFDWKITKWEGPIDYWLISTGSKEESGIDGGLMQRRGEIDGEAVIAYVCTVDVPSFDEYKTKIENEGGINVVAKMAVPGVGWMGYFKDTEGNIFGIMESDPEAK